MPIYEYLCQDCGYKFELKQSMKDDPFATCARCGKSVSRIISPPAIMFKGSGWYITDYSDKMKPSAGESSEATSTLKKETTESASTTPAAPAGTTATTPSSSSSSGGTGASSAPGSGPSSGGSSSSP
ncbi:MAG: FmdB family zinc ribbon protein [Nitrospiraceae bacterium]